MFRAASADWKSDVLPLAAAVALATLQKLWTSYQSHRGETWPISYGKVLKIEIQSQSSVDTFKLIYSYSVGTGAYGGKFMKIFRDSDEADAWKAALSGKQVPVHYHPAKPSRSRLMESDLEPIVQAFAPAASSQPPEPMAWWKRSLLQFGLALACVGFGLCLIESVAEKIGAPLLSRRAYEFLDMGAFIVPVLAIRDVYGSARRTWHAVPDWMKFLEFVMIFYAAFAAFLPHHPARNEQTGVLHRDITYQLPAYLGAIEVLYARLRSDSQNEDYLQRSLGSGVKIG